MRDFNEFEQKTGIKFKNKDLLRQAFTHRSYINENPGVATGHNERLEFLGDAVLELVITDHIFRQYPNRPEGELTAIRAALVNAVTISQAALKLDMNDYLLLSKGESKDTGRARQYILANTFEAFVGAVYIDCGYDVAKKFIGDALFEEAENIVLNKLWRDDKSYVQEKSQEYIGVTPSYRVLAESGPDHDKHFTVGIYFGPNLIAEGKGKSKQEAEQKAARKALEIKNWLD